MNALAPIKTIMTEDVVTLRPDAPFSKVKEIFEKNDFHHIPIIDSEANVVGIISNQNWLNELQNIAKRTTGNTWTNMQYKGLTAQDIMTPNPMVLDPDDGIGLAADVFLANKFHALPIVEDDELKGIITTHDLLQFAFNDVLSERER